MNYYLGDVYKRQMMDHMSTSGFPSQFTSAKPRVRNAILASPFVVGKILFAQTTLEATKGATHGRKKIIRKRLRVLLDLNILISCAIPKDITIFSATVITTKNNVFFVAFQNTGSCTRRTKLSKPTKWLSDRKGL